ncbi:MAG TPA: Asp-tRNA(Asn)/Glu-tRNA(Gln) amidotransferase subunit GatC [Candidatus Saccharimonadales bacterium]|nr:Asp-tRNA(Asn)/Glu-tRNA(Gln) amidotransferase subunit GatC [Candidatus Saccharimonadales bacterium]
MSKLSREEVLKLARLCRLKLSDEEVDLFRGELSEILAYVKKLDEADTGGMQPTYQVTGLKNVMRADEPVEYQAKPADLLAIAPSAEKHQYKVKRVLE